jgi:hypothetical protein
VLSFTTPASAPGANTTNATSITGTGATPNAHVRISHRNINCKLIMHLESAHGIACAPPRPTQSGGDFRPHDNRFDAAGSALLAPSALDSLASAQF